MLHETCEIVSANLVVSQLLTIFTQVPTESLRDVIGPIIHDTPVDLKARHSLVLTLDVLAFGKLYYNERMKTSANRLQITFRL